MFLLINFWKCFLEISKLFSLGDFPGGASSREPVCLFKRCRRLGSVPGLGRSLGGGHGNPLQYSCLDNPMDRGACWAMVHRVTKSWTWLKPLEMQAPKEILQNILTTHCTLWFRKLRIKRFNDLPKIAKPILIVDLLTSSPVVLSIIKELCSRWLFKLKGINKETNTELGPLLLFHSPTVTLFNRSSLPHRYPTEAL